MERAVYRILDANFNRCREGLRVMEEFCRFGLDNRAFSSRCKGLRHELTRVVGRFDAEKLIVCRDSAGDVGSSMRVEKQMARGDLKDCFLAAAKRAGEAFRALAEAGQIIDSKAAAEFERLRFEVYTLEKDVVGAVWGSERFSRVRLYVLVTVEENDDHDAAVEMARECAAGGADCIQLRCKGAGQARSGRADEDLSIGVAKCLYSTRTVARCEGMDDADVLGLAEKFAGVCKEAGVISIINDRADIALASGADGVHLGKGDMPIEHVRKLGARPLIVGVTTHCVEELEEAIAAGADYVGIGPMFSTETKPGLAAAGLGYAAKAMQMLEGTGVGHVAIGGIDINNVDSVLATGVRAVAVCSAVTGADRPVEACRELKGKVKRCKG